MHIAEARWGVLYRYRGRRRWVPSRRLLNRVGPWTPDHWNYRLRDVPGTVAGLVNLCLGRVRATRRHRGCRYRFAYAGTRCLHLLFRRGIHGRARERTNTTIRESRIWRWRGGDSRNWGLRRWVRLNWYRRLETRGVLPSLGRIATRSDTCR